MFEVEIDPDDLAERIARLQRGLPAQIEQARKLLTNLVLQEVKDQTPERTGALKKSLHWISIGPTDELWGLYYGKYVITGTPPHTIRPKNKKYLRFVVEDGKVVFTKLVKHPGTKPNDFRQKALKQVDIQEVLQSLTDWMIEQVM